MKKIILYTLAILQFSALLSSCSDEGDDPNPTGGDNPTPTGTCLIQSFADDEETTTYKYNAQNQIIQVLIDGEVESDITYTAAGKISTQTFADRTDFKTETYTYNANGTIATYVGYDEEQTFYYNGGTNPAYSVNFEGTQYADTSFYTFSGGNLTKVESRQHSTSGSYIDITTFTYDSKKNPTFLQDWYAWSQNANNMTSFTYQYYEDGNLEDGGSFNLTYTYNTNGYPTAATGTDGEDTYTASMTYECK